MRKCARWCGAGCTKEQYDQARRRAKALAKRLGPGWKTFVYENMGWHYNVVSKCGRIKVHEHVSEKGYYTAFFGDPGPGGQWYAHGRTPQQALASVVAQAKRDLRKINAFLKDLPLWRGAA